MEVNQVRFGNYTIGNSTPKKPKKEQQKAEEKTATKANESVKSADGEEVLNAMNIAGIQNKPQINLISRKEVEPSKFLSDDRISDIEAMMIEFESGVNDIANAIGHEFPDMSNANKNALAARIFVQR